MNDFMITTFLITCLVALVPMFFVTLDCIEDIWQDIADISSIKDVFCCVGSVVTLYTVLFAGAFIPVLISYGFCTIIMGYL